MLKKIALFLFIIFLGKGVSLVVPFRHDLLLYREAKDSILFFKWISLSLTGFFLTVFLWKKREGFHKNIILGLVVLMMFLHAFEILSYRSIYYSIQLPNLKKSDFHETLYFYDYPYPEKRSMEYEKNFRFESFTKSVSFARDDFENPHYCIASKWGNYYWNSETFFFFDSCSSIFRVDHRLKDVDRYYKMYGGKFSPLNIEQPMPTHPAFLKILGCNYPKIQFFKNMYYARNFESFLNSPHYNGDVLFTNTKGGDGIFPSIDGSPVSEGILQKNDRIDVPVYVSKFSANGIKIELVNDQMQPIILHYADGFHKYWKAYVNGKETKVYQSNVGFKALLVPPGKVTVDFVFYESRVTYALYFLIFFGVCGVIIIIYYAIKLFKEGNRMYCE